MQSKPGQHDEFLTLSGLSEGYFMDKGSKFLAFAFPVGDETESHLQLMRIKKEHLKARHFCTAMRLLPDGSLERSNDDGEPSGTAGKPILGQLIKYGVTNSMIVVVRYFGGTKLGVPGLIEAYKTSASSALQAATVVTKKVYVPYQLIMEYEQLPLLMNHFKQTHVPVFDTLFQERAIIKVGFFKSTHQKDVMASLRQYTQMDFPYLEDYLKFLNIGLTIMNEKIV